MDIRFVWKHVYLSSPNQISHQSEIVPMHLSLTNLTSKIIDTGHRSLNHASTFLLISDSPWDSNPL